MSPSNRQRLFLLFFLAVGCKQPATASKRVEEPAVKKSDTVRHETKKEEKSCEDRLATLKASGNDGDLSDYYAGLPQLLLTTNIEPVLYLEKPSPTQDKTALQIKAGLYSTPNLYRAVRSLIAQHSKNKALLREVFLSQGYLYEERPSVARALVKEIGLNDLFDSDAIYVHRGTVRRLKLEAGRYVDENGEPFKLLLNDRVAMDRSLLADPLHLDLDEVRRATGALRTIPRLTARRSAWIDLVFPNGDKRPSLVEIAGVDTSVSCVGGDRNSLEQAYKDAERFWRRHEKLVETAKLMVSERPIFDEPDDEAQGDQEDGELRRKWTEAYMQREKTFKMRGMDYEVFDRSGNPVPPEVCIDYFFDIWERSMGSWYNRRGTKPGRTRGELDFSALETLHKRHIPAVLEFASDDSPLDRYDIPRRDQIPFKRTKSFAEALAKHADHFREGDALIIHGIKEEDMEEHYHSVIVLKTDPLTGMPMTVTCNAGRPSIWSLAQAMVSAPRRAIKHRIRIDFDNMDKRR